MSKLPMKLLESWSKNSVAKLGDTLIVHLLVVMGFKIGTKNFASLCVRVRKADKIGLKSGKPSTHFFMHFTRTIHYSRSSFHCFEMSLMRFFWLKIKFKKSWPFTAVFWNLFWSLKKFSIFLTYLSLSNITIKLSFPDLWMTICLFCDRFFEYQILFLKEAHCCYRYEKKTVLYP